MSDKRDSESSEVEKQAFSVDEFGRRWGLGRNSIYSEMARGELETVKVGRRRLVTKSQEERYRRRKEGR